MRSLPAWFLAFLAPAIPAQQVSDYSLFGEGCASPAGVPTLEPIPGSFPTIGETFTLQISNLPVGFFDAQALVLLGFSNTDWAGDPLPMDLSRFGLFGCTGYTSVDAAFLVSSPTDTALFSLDIPSQPRLLGTHFFNQALVQATGTNPFGAVVSNAVEAVVGDTTHAFEIRESFENDTKFDPVASSGSWGNSRVVPGRIGGDGRHGSFDVRSGVEVSPELYRWDTDNTVIPGELTVSGHPELVTDGRYFFTDFVLGPGQTLQFVGSKSAQIFVRGRVDIAGTITANAPHVFQDTLYRFEGTPLAPPRFRPRPSTAVGPIAGEPATIGIVGGGSGGRGGDSGDGLGHQARFDGEDGEDVQLLAGHAYLNRAFGTGGRGTPQFPPSGLNSDVTFNVFFNSRSGMIGAGGGGGGFSSPGSAGEATETASLMPGDLGPIGLGGIEMSLFADAQGSLPPGTASLEHFTIGGPGGGGGGSHPFVGAEATSPPGPDRDPAHRHHRGAGR